MEKEYQESIDKASEHKDEIKRAFAQLKRKKPKNLDDLFQREHEKAFSTIDCLLCANCCKTTSPIFRDIDIKRIAKKLKISEAVFERTYLKTDEDNDWVLKTAPCHFLGSDNICSIYDFRPQACREYPHTDRKKIVQVLDLTERNVSICPAVADITLEVLKVNF